MPPAPLDAGDAGPQTSLPPEVSGAPRPPGRWEEGAPLRRTQSAAPGRRGGPLLTRFLTSADSPYEGPLLNCVELMAGARTEADRLAGGLEGPRPGAPPPPLIGPQRACPYKAGTLHSCGRPLPEPLGVPPSACWQLPGGSLSSAGSVYPSARFWEGGLIGPDPLSGARMRAPLCHLEAAPSLLPPGNAHTWVAGRRTRTVSSEQGAIGTGALMDE